MFKLQKCARRFCSLVLIIFLFSCNCGCSKKEKRYYIGIDPSFFPLILGPMENNTYGFTRELFLEIAEELNCCFFIVKSSSNYLFDGLQEIKYQGLISSAYPYDFLLNKYNFSNVFLKTGTALIAKKEATVNSMEDMKGKFAGYIRGDDSVFVYGKTYSIMLKDYDSLSSLMIDLHNGFLDGAFIDVIRGSGMVNNVYSDEVEIKLSLNNNGLRLISLKKEEEIIKLFNEGLAKLEKKGIVDKLRRKWNFQ